MKFNTGIQVIFIITCWILGGPGHIIYGTSLLTNLAFLRLEEDTEFQKGILQRISLL